MEMEVLEVSIIMIITILIGVIETGTGYKDTVETEMHEQMVVRTLVGTIAAEVLVVLTKMMKPLVT